MELTRRGALATVAAGAAASIGPTGVSAGSGRATDRSPSGVQSGDGGFEVEWDRAFGSDAGLHCVATAPTGDGGIVAACNLVIDDEGTATATRLVEVSADGQSSTVGTIGNPDYDRRQYWFWDVEPAIDDGYVLVGYETQYSVYGNLDDVVPRFVHVQSSGEAEWSSQVQGSPTTFQLPEPRAVVANGDQYVVASRDYEGGPGTVLAGYDASGEERWRRAYDANVSPAPSPVALEAGADGVVLLGVSGSGDENARTRPVLASLAANGTVDERANPAVPNDRVPRGVAERDGRYLVVGTAHGEVDAATGGWAMELPELTAAPEWQDSIDAFGASLSGAAGSTLFDGWVWSGTTHDDRGRLLAGTDVSAPSITHTADESGSYEDVQTAADGTAMVVGRTGTGSQAELLVSRVSAALDPGELTATVEPTSVAPGETVSLELDVGGYDADLLTAEWSADGSTLASGFSGETSFDSAGEYVVVATVTTGDDRSVEVEQTVTVGSTDSTDEGGSDPEDGDEDDGDGGGGGMPGFGVLAAAAGLAGGAALRRRSTDGD